MKLVEEILSCLSGADARVKASKLILCQESVFFLGMTLTGFGWDLSQKFKQAISQAPVPDSLRSLRGFLKLLS